MTIPPIRLTYPLMLLLSLSAVALRAQFAQSSYTISVAGCNEQAAICTDYTQNEFGAYTYTLNGAAYQPGWLACNQQQIVAYSVSDLPDDGYSGPYDIVSLRINGSAVSGSFADPGELVGLLRAADPSGNWSFDLATLLITGGTPSSTYSDIEVYHPLSTRNYIVRVQQTSTEGFAQFRFPVGDHVLSVLDGSTLIERVAINVSCAPPASYTRLTLTTPSVVEVCPDLSALQGPIVASSVSVSPQPRHVSFALGNNDCFNVTAFGNGIDSVALRYCDAANNCATAYYLITAKPAVNITPSTVFDTVTVEGSVITFCVDTTQLPGTITSVSNICPGSSGTYVDFTLLGNNACIKYRGLTAGGTDTACVVVCDDLGFCDTTRIVVTTTTQVRYPDQELSFTIDKGSIGSTVLDLSAFRQNPNAIANVCPEQSGSFVNFSVDVANRSVDFAGREVGTERACYRASSADGSNQLFRITVRVVTRSASRDTIRMRNGESRSWCFGAFELPDQPVRLFDACPAANPVVNTSASGADITCLDFRSLRVGTQDLCLTLCDAAGVCDLVDLVVEVLPNNDDRLPEANDDIAFLPASGTVSLQPLANDTSLEPLTYTAVIIRPLHGLASFLPGGALEYVATDATACLDDEMVYEICNSYGCDQASIRITANCDGGAERPKLIAASGFSPNGDGVNDTWVLRNIEFYPGAVIKVYNRWGARVLEVKNYANDWNGQFGDDLLPDGTYFYVADLPNAEPASGWVQIRR